VIRVQISAKGPFPIQERAFSFVQIRIRPSLMLDAPVLRLAIRDEMDVGVPVLVGRPVRS